MNGKDEFRIQVAFTVDTGRLFAAGADFGLIGKMLRSR